MSGKQQNVRKGKRVNVQKKKKKKKNGVSENVSEKEQQKPSVSKWSAKKKN